MPLQIDVEKNIEFDYTEFYRQNYEDTLDEIRNLRYTIRELEEENKMLKNLLLTATKNPQ